MIVKVMMIAQVVMIADEVMISEKSRKQVAVAILVVTAVITVEEVTQH